jgi:hypothetical protein
MTKDEIGELIKKIEERIEFLKTDKTKWHSVWAGPKGYTPYDHGPYFRKAETKKLKTKLNTLKKKLSKL